MVAVYTVARASPTLSHQSAENDAASVPTSEVCLILVLCCVRSELSVCVVPDGMIQIK